MSRAEANFLVGDKTTQEKFNIFVNRLAIRDASDEMTPDRASSSIALPNPLTSGSGLCVWGGLSLGESLARTIDNDKSD